MKMPIELKTKWVKALRSGKYKQGRGSLYNPETKSFCCLGVLEHICLNGNVEKYNQEDATFRLLPSIEFYNSFGIGDYDDVITDESALANMNDGSNCAKPKSFRAIADYIVKNIEAY